MFISTFFPQLHWGQFGGRPKGLSNCVVGTPLFLLGNLYFIIGTLLFHVWRELALRAAWVLPPQEVGDGISWIEYSWQWKLILFELRFFNYLEKRRIDHAVIHLKDFTKGLITKWSIWKIDCGAIDHLRWVMWLSSQHLSIYHPTFAKNSKQWMY